MCGPCLDPDSNKPGAKKYVLDVQETLNMDWVLSDIEDAHFILLGVKKVLWLCKKMLLRPLEMHTDVVQNVMTWYPGLALKCFEGKIKLERERDEINMAKY